MHGVDVENNNPDGSRSVRVVMSVYEFVDYDMTESKGVSAAPPYPAWGTHGALQAVVKNELHFWQV